jgi:ketoreductase RED1
MSDRPADLLARSEVLQRREHVGVIGAGVIGTSWTALMLAHGLAVRVFDPDPDVGEKLLAGLDAIAPALAAQGLPTDGLAERLSVVASTDAAVEGADVVQENGPEDLGFKQRLWAQVEAAAPAHVLMLSSTSGHPATGQAQDLTDPSRLLVGHPFNPPHMVPLVEVVPGEHTDPAAVEEAVAFYRALGKKPLVLRKEKPGFVANRLQSALFQECVSLVSEGVVGMADLDEVVTSSIGMRWAVNGPFLTFHLGGGPGGLPHFLEHLGPGMQRRWDSLGHPRFDEPTKALLTAAVEEAYGDRSLPDLERQRDARQLAVLKALDDEKPDTLEEQ